MEAAKGRIASGLIAYNALLKIRTNPKDLASRATLDVHSADLGYALLLKHFRSDIQNATQSDIANAASSTIPNVPVLFWSFRIMVGLGFWFIALFGIAFWLAGWRRLGTHRSFLWAALLTLPLPWLAAELGGSSPNMAANPG